MTTHEAMVAWAAAIQEYRRAQGRLDVAGVAYFAGPLLGQAPRCQAWEDAMAVRDVAYTTAHSARAAACRTYEDSAPSGASQLLLKLAGEDMYGVDVDTIEAIIAAVFAAPPTRPPCAMGGSADGTVT